MKLNIKEVKYVFFDMDGTLLSLKKEISNNTIDTLKKLTEKEINISIATGRPYYFLFKELEIVKPKLPVITCNGALVYDWKSNKIISCSPISKEATKKIYETLINHNAVFLVYAKDQLFMIKNDQTNPNSKWFDWVLENIQKNNLNEKIKISKIDYKSDFDVTKYDVIKFLVIDSEMQKENALDIEKEVNLINEVYIVRSQENVFDIMPHGMSKGNGLLTLSQQNIIDLNQTIVFGDADNDLSMFKIAKWSVAMGNANDNVKQASSFVTKNNDQEGIVYFFNEILKI